jgi:hypothetical protein
VLVPLPTDVAFSVDLTQVTITLAKTTTTAYNTRWDADQELSSSQSLTFLPNNILTLTLDAAIQNASGTRTLTSDVVVSFFTELFPKYSTNRMAYGSMQGLAAILSLTSPELDYFLYEESKWLAAMLVARAPGTRIDLPKQIWIDFVNAKCRWRLISETVTYQSSQGSFQSKRLGDFSVTKSFGSPPQAMTKLLAKFENEWESALSAILPATLFTCAIKGLNSPYRHYMNPDLLSGRRMEGADSSGGSQQNSYGYYDDLLRGR